MAQCNKMLPGCAREFGEISESLKNGEERDYQIITKLDKMSAVILGNGEEGLVGRINNLENSRSWMWKLALFVMPPVTAVSVLLLKKWIT